MLPRIILSDAPKEFKSSYIVIRADTMQEIPGEINSANCDNGDVTMVGGSTQQFGPKGIIIIPKGR